MFRKKLCIALVAFLLLHDSVLAKKSRKTRRPKPEEEDYTPQPSVVSYSTFGFNDVGTYEGFVPSSPDYAKLLSNGNPDSDSRPLPSGYPTSPDSNDYGSNYNGQPFSGQSFTMSEDGGLQTASFVQHPQNAVSVYNTQSFGPTGERNAASDEIYGRNVEEINAPSYGTKINLRNRIRPNPYNNTDMSGPSGAQNDEKYSNIQESKPAFENQSNNDVRPVFDSRPGPPSGSGNSFYNHPSYPSPSASEYNKPMSGEALNTVKFQRVVDFTKLKPYHSNELDTSRLPTATPIPNLYENESAQNMFINSFDVNNNSQKQFFNPTSKNRDIFKPNYNNEDERNAYKVSNYKEEPYHPSGKDNLLISHADPETKKKPKQKPWSSGAHVYKKWKEPTSSSSKGYEYSTNYSSMSFSYDSDKEKIIKPLGSSIDELIPASSNLDLSNYQFPDVDFSNFKKMPEYKVHEEDEYASFPSFKDFLKPKEMNYDHYKHGFSTPPTTTAFFGNLFKPEQSSLKSYQNKYKFRDNEEIVNIPRRPNRVNYEKPFESKHNEWSQYNRRPYKNRPIKDWNSDTPITRFKSEEDLLGLRNQDTSHPSYLPSYQSNFLSEDVDYKKLVEKWRQAYLKSKLKDSLRDYESYGTETKSKHVPLPKPYPIEVPHPVIVPVPQPYPVRVPIGKPVAVPVIREIKIPVEKPMPYLVYKEVPYPIEKPVPVPVEKEVPVPVVKPYPVHIPYIRPVFHHTKSRDEYDSDHRDDDDYLPRPSEGKNKYNGYKKKIPNGSRNRPSRRPSRTAYQDRNRRRWPERRRPDGRDDRETTRDRMRPMELHHPSPFKRRDAEPMRFQV